MKTLRAAVVAILSLVLAGPALGQAPDKDRLTECIDRGLVSLARLQDPKDGGWQLKSDPPPHLADDMLK